MDRMRRSSLGILFLWATLGLVTAGCQPDGVIDEGGEDGDGDGYCPDQACVDGVEPGDCDDEDATVHPGADEGCDGIDTDCDGELGADEVDADGDDVMVCDGDCDDGDAGIHPGAEEACDGVDTDCDGAPADEEEDADGDGFMGCDGDCDDADDAVFPGAEEACNGIDDD